MRGVNGNEEAVMFLTGNNEKIVFIVASYKNIDGKTPKLIRDCMQSVYWEKAAKVNPFEDAHFEIDRDSQFLNFVTRNVGYMYAIKGSEKKGDKTEAFLMLVESYNSLYNNLRKNDLQQQCEAYLKELESKGQKINLKKQGYIKTKNGYRAFEILCENQLDPQKANQKGTLYIILIEAGEYLYLLNFMDVSKFYEDPKIFRKITDSLKSL